MCRAAAYWSRGKCSCIETELVKLVAAALADGSVCKPPTPVESKTPWKVGAEEKAPSTSAKGC
eukprot:1517862-Amphidinium_carterae.1